MIEVRENREATLALQQNSKSSVPDTGAEEFVLCNKTKLERFIKATGITGDMIDRVLEDLTK